jgi:hypothetical protein
MKRSIKSKQIFKMLLEYAKNCPSHSNLGLSAVVVFDFRNVLLTACIQNSLWYL